MCWLRTRPLADADLQTFLFADWQQTFGRRKFADADWRGSLCYKVIWQTWKSSEPSDVSLKSISGVRGKNIVNAHARVQSRASALRTLRIYWPDVRVFSHSTSKRWSNSLSVSPTVLTIYSQIYATPRFWRKIRAILCHLNVQNNIGHLRIMH